MTYSGGMRPRLDLAMTLVGSPRIIFLDEPTTGLDPRSRRGVRDVIRALVAGGVTVFFASARDDGARTLPVPADGSVRSLRALLDRLDSARAEAENLSVRLPAVALAAVATAPGLPANGEAAPEAASTVFCREGEYWTVRYDGSVARLKDAKGLRYVARLLAHPGREFYAADLEEDGRQVHRPAASAACARAGAGELTVRPDLGDAGPLLDARAKAAYKARLDELAAELEEAECCNDPGRAATARQEQEFLVRELARAVGLGGRDRRAASHAERARLNVTRAIRAAMANLARANPSLGRHLAAAIRTGRYCSYTPDPRAPITWEL
jgi:hypothetical protein